MYGSLLSHAAWPAGFDPEGMGTLVLHTVISLECPAVRSSALSATAFELDWQMERSLPVSKLAAHFCSDGSYI